MFDQEGTFLKRMSMKSRKIKIRILENCNIYWRFVYFAKNYKIFEEDAMNKRKIISPVAGLRE